MKTSFFIIFLILLVGILYFDFWVYKNFVLGAESRALEGEQMGLFLLKTPLLEKAAEEIKKRNDFLENPVYPSIKNPF